MPDSRSGRDSKWKTKVSGEKRTEMTIAHIKANANRYRHILTQPAPSLGAATLPAGAAAPLQCAVTHPQGVYIPRRIIEHCADGNSNFGEIAARSESETTFAPLEAGGVRCVLSKLGCKFVFGALGIALVDLRDPFRTSPRWICRRHGHDAPRTVRVDLV